MVGIIGKLFLAVAVLVSQTGTGLLTCVCPEAPQKLPAAPTKVCPVTMAPGCACCAEAPANNPAAKDTGAKLSMKAPECKVAANDNHQALKAVQSTAEVEAPAALSPAASPLPSVPLAAPVPSIHLIVPRIRPPDERAHGLRAPPAS
ncbi:MAG: hypothetical protein JST30_01585 [Armatimonadetes bacterium]|nr:hypothetical protein [Armatimonadota bacterium]